MYDHNHYTSVMIISHWFLFSTNILTLVHMCPSNITIKAWEYELFTLTLV